MIMIQNNFLTCLNKEVLRHVEESNINQTKFVFLKSENYKHQQHYRV